MKHALVLVTILGLIALSPLVAAAEPTVTLRAFSSEACPTGSAKYAVDITNPGNAPDTYTVSTDVPWSTVAPQSLEIDGGETDTVFLWLQPPATMRPGSHGFDVQVASSNTGETVTTSGTLNVLSCRAVSLSVDQASQTVCRGETASYAVEVANTGEATETYRLTADAGALSRQEVTLDPGESTTVELTAFSNVEADRTLNVRAESTTSFASDEISVDFTAERCKAVNVFVAPSDTTVCEQEPAEFSITVQNTGQVEDTYALSTNVDGANVPSLTLGPGESQTFTVTITEDAGEHAVVARATSRSFSGVSRSEDATLHVENCYDLVIASQGNNSIQVGRDNRTLLEFRLFNKGTRTNTYDLAFDGPEWADLRPIDAEVAPGEERSAFLYVAPDFFSEDGVYTSKLTVTDESGQISRVVDINITLGNQTVTAETTGEDRTLTGQIVRRAGGLAVILLVLAALFVAGYVLFQRQWAAEENGVTDENRNGNGNGEDEAPTHEEVRDEVRRLDRPRDQHGRFVPEDEE